MLRIIIDLVLADQYSERYKNIIFAAESRIAADSQQAGATAEVKSRVTTSNIRAETLSSEKGFHTSTVTPSTDEAILSRVNELKALVVDEGPHREGKFLHTIESRSFQKWKGQPSVVTMTLCRRTPSDVICYSPRS